MVQSHRAVLLVVASLLVVLLLVFPTQALPSSQAGGATVEVGRTGVPSEQSRLYVNVSGQSVSPYFRGTTVSPRSPILPNEAEIFEATGTNVLLWPGASTAEVYNPLNNTIFSLTNGKPTWTIATTSEAQFAALCRSINCTPILQVPGEIDDTSLAASIVNYTYQTLGLRPLAWEIGNEPELWTHWNESWNNWTVSGTSTPTADEYAAEVARYVVSMQAADNSTKFIGIPGTGRNTGGSPLSAWITAVINATGPSLSAVAFHEYPAPNNIASGGTSLYGFYHYINSTSGLPQRYAGAVGAVHAAGSSSVSCKAANDTANCSKIPVFITEIGSALSHGVFSSDSAGMPGGLDLAAQTLEGLTLSIPNIDLFASVFDTSNSWIWSNGSVRPDYIVYADFLSHLGNEYYNASVIPTGHNLTPQDRLGLKRSIYAGETIDTTDHNRTDLLLVNLNSSQSATISPILANISAGTPVEEWEWNGSVINATGQNQSLRPNSAEPVARYLAGGLPSTFTLANQSITLFESYPHGGESFNFTEHSLPSGARWFLSTGSKNYTSNGSTIPTFLAAGTYPIGSTPIEIPFNSTPLHDRERFEPYLPSSVTSLSSVPNVTIISVNFSKQWAINASAVPSNGGRVSPAVQWWNSSASLTLTEAPNQGFFFRQWSGYGNGSVNSTSPTITLTVNGWINEHPDYSGGYPVSFNETGLPGGTNWSVSVGGTPASANTSSISFELTNGSHGFSVGQIPGYRSKPANSSVDVTGTPQTVPVIFTPLSPPGTQFPMVFSSSGLPSGTAWSIVIRNTTYSSLGGAVALNLTNGTYRYSVQPVAGYRESPASGWFRVNGTQLNFTITFVLMTPPGATYPVSFSELGLPTNTTWAITTRGNAHSTTGSTVLLNATNGTYWFTVSRVAGYRAVPPNGRFIVNGTGKNLTIQFQNLTHPIGEYEVSFHESGLPSGTNWSVTVRSITYTSVGPVLEFNESNSSYWYSVGAVAGYRAAPNDGSLVVNGSAISLNITFIARTPPGQTYMVEFEATGLPSGTPWSIQVRGVTETSMGVTIVWNETDGRYGFKVVPVHGFRSSPTNSSFLVNGSLVVVPVEFIALTPVPGVYGVTFSEVGLPALMAWSVTVRGVKESSLGGALEFNETNGSYGYQVTPIPAFHDASINQGFEVDGAALALTVDFVPEVTTFDVIWNESGLWFPTEWTIQIGNESYAANSSWFQEPLANGSYSVVITGPSGFIAQPHHESVTVRGEPLREPVVFLRALFDVRFTVVGLPVDVTWGLRFSDALVHNIGGHEADLSAANGTYTYVVLPPSGYFAAPSHGAVRVNATPVTLSLGFFPLGIGPHPPTVMLAVKAALVVSVALLGAVGGFALVRFVHRRQRGGPIERE
jgi:hypothetical protein